MTDPDFLAECGIVSDPVWLLEQEDLTPEGRKHIEDLLRINMLCGGLSLTLSAYKELT